MGPEPVGQLGAIDPACREVKYRALLNLDGGMDLGAVEDQECLHRGMADALVAVCGFRKSPSRTSGTHTG